VTEKGDSRSKPLDISEVASKSGVPASALRFYEQRGLITSIGRRGLRRLFATSVLERLAFISLGQSAGLSLDEIAGMFSPEGKLQIDRKLLSLKDDSLDGTIRKLTAMRDGLRHAAVCPAPSHMECPTFQRLLRSALPSKSVTLSQKKHAKTRPPNRRVRR